MREVCVVGNTLSSMVFANILSEHGVRVNLVSDENESEDSPLTFINWQNNLNDVGLLRKYKLGVSSISIEMKEIEVVKNGKLNKIACKKKVLKNLLSLKGRISLMLYNILSVNKNVSVDEDTVQEFLVKKFHSELYSYLIQSILDFLIGTNSRHLCVKSNVPYFIDKIGQINNLDDLINLKVNLWYLKKGYKSSVQEMKANIKNLNEIKGVANQVLFEGDKKYCIISGQKVEFEDIFIGSKAFVASKILRNFDLYDALKEIEYNTICDCYINLSKNTESILITLPSIEKNYINNIANLNKFNISGEYNTKVTLNEIKHVKIESISENEIERIIKEELSSIFKTDTINDIKIVIKKNLSPKKIYGYHKVLAKLDEIIKTNNNIYLGGDYFMGQSLNAELLSARSRALSYLRAQDI